MSIHKRTYKRKDGTTSMYYLAVVKVSGQKPISKQFDRKIDAETWERKLRVDFDSDATKSTECITMTMKELGAKWFEMHVSKNLEHSTFVRYDGMFRNYVLPTFGNAKLQEVSPLKVERWLHHMTTDGDLENKTANNALGLLKKMLTDGVRWGYVKFNPIACVKPLPEGQQDFRFWTIEEAQKYLRYIREVDETFFKGVAIALYTGMRLGEIQALKWDSADFAMRQIAVRRTYCLKSHSAKEWTKTKKVRRIPINESLAEILLSLPKDSEYVLPEFPYHHAARILKRTAALAGVKPIKFHDLRHSFASNFMMRGGDIYKLQRLLGHTSVQMTERYAHLSPEHLKDATSILDFGTKKEGNVLRFSKSG